MGSDERLLNQGRLVEAEQRAQHLAIKLHGLKRQLREQTDPHRPIAELDVSVLRVVLDDLATTEAEYQRTLTTIAALREDLGLPRYETH